VRYVVILLGKGRTAVDVADALLIDPDTVRSYFTRCCDPNPPWTWRGTTDKA